MRPLLVRLLALAGLLAAGPQARADERPLTALPYVPGLDVAAMDRSADPCLDFYQYACGGWVKANPIPGDQARWSVYRKMALENRQFLWGLLLGAAAKPASRRSPVEARAGDYFAACTDEAAVERAGAAPLAKDLAAIAALRSPRDLATLLGRLQPTLGGDLFFAFTNGQDGKDASRVVGVLYPGGMGLPDRDYYVKQDPRSLEIRARYEAYLARLLALTGDAPEAAAEGARTVMRLETALARASLTRVEKRDPYRVYHPTARARLARVAPALDWERYLGAVGAPARLDLVNVTEPAFFYALSGLVAKEPVASLRTYLRARLADARAPSLSRDFQRAHFELHDAFLQGVKEEQPRWKKCVAWADRDLGEDVGQLFVARAFPAAVKAQVLDMTRRIRAAMEAHLRDLPWRGPATRRAALAKLRAMRDKIGYPDRWRGYPGLRVERGDFAGDVARAGRFETARLLAKIGRPLDRGGWNMTAPTVNAHYDPQLNDMNFPAGVLLPPLWDPAMDLAPGYGNTGATIGHELTHGFDDEGRQFDARGNLRDWWTPADARAFAERTACVVAQFAGYTVVDEVKINSKLTVGEDVADLGGTALAWDSWKDATRGEALEPRDGLTPAQRFFVGNAQWACEDETDASKRVHAVTDPHSPGKWRVNGLFANLPPFREAFACRTGQPMAPEQACRVW